MAKQESTSIRIPTELFEKLKAASNDLGDPGANWLGTRCLTEMMELAETEEGARRVPRIIRQLDGARSEGKLLESTEPSRGANLTPGRSRGGHRPIVVKAGKG